MSNDDKKKLGGKVAKILALATSKHMHEQLRASGQLLAQANEMGVMLGVGDTNPDNRRQRWFAVLCTNDAADHLERFAREQADERKEASAGTDIEVFTHVGTGKDVAGMMADLVGDVCDCPPEKKDEPPYGNACLRRQ